MEEKLGSLAVINSVCDFSFRNVLSEVEDEPQLLLGGVTFIVVIHIVLQLIAITDHLFTTLRYVLLDMLARRGVDITPKRALATIGNGQFRAIAATRFVDPILFAERISHVPCKTRLNVDGSWMPHPIGYGPCADDLKVDRISRNLFLILFENILHLLRVRRHF